MTYKIIITSDNDRIEAVVKNKDLEDAKGISRKLWNSIDSPVFLSIKELKGNGKLDEVFGYVQNS